MNYPCGIIKDLLPLYIDDVCNNESRQAVESHLAECEDCRKYHDIMKATEGYVDKENLADVKMANSLKNVKNKINKKITKIVLCAVSVALVCIGGYHLLFNAAIKEVPLENLSFSANVYSVEELIDNQKDEMLDSDSVIISADKNDSSQPITVRIPEIGDAVIHITENTMDKYQALSVITVQSDYFLRNVEKERIDDTIYIKGIKTTLLNNKATAFQHNTCGLEFGEINRIVFVAGNGTETVLWSRLPN